MVSPSPGPEPPTLALPRQLSIPAAASPGAPPPGVFRAAAAAADIHRTRRARRGGGGERVVAAIPVAIAVTGPGIADPVADPGLGLRGCRDEEGEYQEERTAHEQSSSRRW